MWKIEVCDTKNRIQYPVLSLRNLVHLHFIHHITHRLSLSVRREKVFQTLRTEDGLHAYAYFLTVRWGMYVYFGAIVGSIERNWGFLVFILSGHKERGWREYGGLMGFEHLTENNIFSSHRQLWICVMLLWREKSACFVIESAYLINLIDWHSRCY